MDNIHQNLQNNPLFCHLTDREVTSLANIGKIESITKGKKLELKNLNSFAIVISGMFEFESPVKRDVIYLTPGAFFGEKPFTGKKRKGFVRAVTDSEILLFDVAELYNFFLSSYKGLKGYIKNINKMGFEITEPAKEHFGNGSKIITVYSSDKDSGNSIFSAFLGLSISEHGKTIILDASSHGTSIFNIFERDLSPAISQKEDEDASTDQFINDRIANIDENLSLINITSGSKVKVNPDIISPVLFFLSKTYKYIIIDLSDYDKEFRNGIFCFSDIVFTLIKRVKDRGALYDLFDMTLTGGQRVYYVMNRFYAKGVGTFEGGYIFDELEFNKDESIISNLCRHVKDNPENEFVRIVTSKRTGLVVQTNLLESVFNIALFNALHKAEINIDLLYSSSWSFFIASLFLLSNDYSEFEKNVLKVFSEERINSFLDITFPNEFVFKNSKIFKYARDIAGDKRIEIYRTLPMVMLTDQESEQRRIFSTGQFKDLISASFILFPVFESFEIAGKFYNSGFPFNRVKPEDLFRTDVNEIIYAKVKNEGRLMFGENKALPFYKRYIDHLYLSRSPDNTNYAADRTIDIDVNVKEYNLDEIQRVSEDIANNLL